MATRAQGSARTWKSRIVGHGEEDPAQLLASPLNHRIHPKAQQSALQDLLSDVGYIGGVTVSRATGYVLDGHLRVQLAISRGEPTIPVDYVDLTPEEEVKVVTLHDAIGSMAGIDPAILQQALDQVQTDRPALQAALDGLRALAQSLPQREGLFPPEGLRPNNGLSPLQGDPDTVPEGPEEREPLTRPGDILRLGRHTLGCLDSTNLDEVRRLLGAVTPDMVWTDPPYGIEVAARGHVGITNLAPRGTYRPMIGDETTATAVAAYRICEQLGPAVLVLWGANHYASALPDAAGWIVWDKQNDGNPFADGELAWTNGTGPLRIFRHQWQGMMRASERGERRLVPSQKPVALAEWCFAQYGKEGDVVLDLFVGSGTAIIACEKTGRTLYGAEISPHYVDVAARRFQQATGIVPVLAATDEPRDFLSP